MKSTTTSQIQKLLLERKRIKKSKPYFVVKATSFSDRVKERWRNPRGLHSPIRQKYRGKPMLVKVGYGSPAEVRGLHSSGLKPVVVHTVKEIMAVDAAVQGVVIGSGVGAKKRLALFTAAAEKKVRILNVRDSVKAAAQIKESFESRQKVRADRFTSKSKKDEEKKKVAEKKQKEAELKKAAEKKGSDAGHADHSHESYNHTGPAHAGEKDAAAEEQRKMAEKIIIKG